MGLLGSLYVDVGINNKMGTEITSISTGLVALENKMKSAAVGMSSSFGGALSTLKQMPAEMKYLGAGLALGVTAPILAFGKAATTTFSNFDDTMRQVAAVTGATGEKFTELTALAREMGETTSFKASEAAEAMTYLGMAGFTADEIISSLPATLALARAGVLDLGSAADIMSNVMTIFGLETDQAAHTADVLAKVAHSTNTNVIQLGEAMTYAGPVASTFGLSMEMTAAAMGMLGNAGIQASMAGTTLRGILQELVAPTKASTAIFEKYGLTLEDLNPKVHGLDVIFKTLKESGMSDAEMFQIFGQRAGPGLQALLKQGIDTLGDYSIELTNIDGYAEHAAETMDTGFGGAIRRMNSAIESFSITMGSRLAVILYPFVNLITDIAAAFAQMNPVGQTFITVLAGIAMAAGPLILLMAGLPMIVSGVTAALGFFDLTAAGVLGTLSGIAVPVAAVAAGLYILEEKTGLVTKTWQLFSDMATIVWYGLKGTVSEVVSFIGGLVDELSSMLDGSIFGGFVDSVSTAFTSVSGVFSGFLGDVHECAEQYREENYEMQKASEETAETIEVTGDIAGEAYGRWGQDAWTMRDDVVTASEEAASATQEASDTYSKAVQDMMDDVNTTMAAGIDYMAGVDIDDLRRGIRTVNDELIILNDSNELVKVSADGTVTKLKDMGMVNFETTRGGLTVMTDGIDESGRAAEDADKLVNELHRDVIIVGDAKLTNLTGEIETVNGSIVTANSDTLTWQYALDNTNAFEFTNLDGELTTIQSEIEDVTAADDDLNGNFIVTDSMPFGTLHGNLDMSKAKIDDNTSADKELNTTLNLTNYTPFGTLFGNLSAGGIRVNDLRTQTDNTNSSIKTLGSFSFSTTLSGLGNIGKTLDSIYEKAKSAISKLLEVGSSSSSPSSSASSIASGTSGVTSSGGTGTGESNVKIVSSNTKINTVNNYGTTIGTTKVKSVS